MPGYSRDEAVVLEMRVVEKVGWQSPGCSRSTVDLSLKIANGARAIAQV